MDKHHPRLAEDGPRLISGKRSTSRIQFLRLVAELDKRIEESAGSTALRATREVQQQRPTGRQTGSSD